MTTTNATWITMGLACALACTAAACSDDDAPVEDPAEHACEHRAMGGSAITASADRASAPEIAIGDEPYTVTPSATEPTYLKVVVPGDTAALLFVGIADAVSGLYEGDAEATLPEGAPNEICPGEIPEHFDLDFHEAGDWFVELAPSAAPSFWLMLTDATGHAHEALVLSDDPRSSP